MKRVGQIYRDSLINTIKENVKENKSVFLLSYSKLSSLQISDLRKDLKRVGASVHVTKNKLARIAFKDLEHQQLAEKIEGQTAFVWSCEDSIAISKILMKLSDDVETFNIRGGILDNCLLEEADINKLSKLSSREVLLAQLLGTIQAPITHLLGAFNAKSRELLSIMKQLSEKRGGNE